MIYASSVEEDRKAYLHDTKKAHRNVHRYIYEPTYTYLLSLCGITVKNHQMSNLSNLIPRAVSREVWRLLRNFFQPKNQPAF